MSAVNSDPPKSLGDPAQWVDRYGDALLRYAITRVPTREIAEDLVQDTFLAALKHRSKFDGKCEFGTWLVAILRRKIADQFRIVEKTAPLHEAASTSDGQFDARGKWIKSPRRWYAAADELVETAEFWTVVQSCIGQLPTHLAHAFRLREVQQMTSDDAAKSACVTTQNLAVRLYRARLLMRECLEKHWFRGEPRKR